MQSIAAESRRGFLSRLTRAAVVSGTALGASSALAADDNGPRRRRPGKRIAYRTPVSSDYSRAVRYGDTIYLSNVFGSNKNGLFENDFELQVSRALNNLTESLSRSGSSIHDVLQCTCYLTRSDKLAKFNKIYGEFFPKAPPARSVAIVKELERQGAMIAIDCVCTPA